MVDQTLERRGPGVEGREGALSWSHWCLEMVGPFAHLLLPPSAFAPFAFTPR